MNPYKITLLKSFAVKSFPKPIQFFYMTPLLSLQQQQQVSQVYGQMPQAFVNRKIYAGRIENRVLVLTSEHFLAVRRSKLFNSKREFVLKTLHGRLKKPITIYIKLNNIVKWLPNSILGKHINFCMDQYKNKIISQAEQVNLRQMVNNIEKYSASWEEYIKISDRFPTFDENTHKIIELSTIVLLQHSPERQLIYQDMQMLQQTFKKFNFFQFFQSLNKSNQRKGSKLCQRFVKMTKFRSNLTEQYLLHYLKDQNIDLVILRINILVRIYRDYFQQRL